MIQDPSQPTRLRELVNRCKLAWSQRMGWPGAVALLLIVAAVGLASAARPGFQQEREAVLKRYVARLDETVRVSNAASAAAANRDPRDLVRDALPSVADRGKSVTQLLSLLGEAQVGATRGEYVMEDQAPDLVRMRVSFPVRAAYAPLRRLTAKVLNEMPHAALDNLDLELLGEDEQLEGKFQLSLFFRKERP